MNWTGHNKGMKGYRHANLNLLAAAEIPARTATYVITWNTPLRWPSRPAIRARNCCFSPNSCPRATY